MRFFYTFLFLLSLGCGASLPSSPRITENAVNTPNPLRIIIIDVGQGDATLVLTPSNHALLIDGGPPESGIRATVPLLENLGLSRLDYLLISHYDADHIGGIPEVVAGPDLKLGNDDDFLPDFDYDGGDPIPSGNPIFDKYFSSVGSERISLNEGAEITFPDGVKITCLIINGKTASGKQIQLEPDDDNGRSMGLLITYGGFRYFTAGDLPGGGMTGSQITQNLEDLVASEVGPVDVLHVDHHGSATSSSKAFLQTLSPTVSVISMGKENKYGHPAPEVLWRLHDVGSRIYQTEDGSNNSAVSDVIVGGDITVSVDKNGYTVDGDKYEFKESR